VGLLTLVFGGGDGDVFAGEGHVATGDQIGTGDRQVVTRVQGQVAVDAADGAARPGNIRPGVGGFTLRVP
jgi:hypothetical protein